MGTNNTEYVKEPGLEPLPGYRLIQPLGRGGFGEVWKCEVPGGIFKAIKFVRGKLDSLDPELTAQQEQAACERIKLIRHPFVLSLETVHVVQGELIIVTELADKNLEDRLQECSKAGLTGIPRNELLAQLSEAAEALDVMNLEHGLQHLDIKPSNLFLVGKHLKVADFGLVQSLEQLNSANSAQIGGGITPLYSAPELFENRVSGQCDQYSLAIVYQELLTGTLPFTGKNSRQIMLQHMMGTPNLEPLPETDRPVVAKAMAKKPGERYDSCQEFIQELQQAGSAAQQPSDSSPEIVVIPAAGSSLHQAGPGAGDLRLIRPSSKSDSYNRWTPGPSDTNPAKRSDSRSTGVRFVGEEASGGAAPFAEIPGYEFRECLTSGLPGGLWKVRADKGGFFTARFLNTPAEDAAELEPMCEQFLRLSHSALLPQQIIRVNEFLVLLTRLLQPTLQECCAQDLVTGLRGLDRRDLLKSLYKAAVALDELAEEHNVRHLSLNPNSIVIGRQDGRLIDFGLVDFFWLTNTSSLRGLNPRYSAPEVFDDRISATSDQYSLALICAELLTGFHPRLQPPRPRSRVPSRLDLTYLSSTDQKILAKGLAEDPERRFVNCQELISQFKMPRQVPISISRSSKDFPLIVPVSDLVRDTPGRSSSPVPNVADFIHGYFSSKVAMEKMLRCGQYHCALLRGNLLECSFPVHVHDGLLQSKLESFCERWKVNYERRNGNCFAFCLEMHSGILGRMIGKKAGIEVLLSMRPSASIHATYVESRVIVRPFGGKRQLSALPIEALGPEILNDLCGCLQPMPEKRKGLRFSVPEELIHVYPVLSRSKIGEVLPATVRDVSLEGLGLTMSHEPPSEFAYLQLTPSTDAEDFAVLAQFAWSLANELSGYSAGVRVATSEADTD